MTDRSSKGECMKIFGNSLKLVIVDLDGVLLDLLAKFQKNMEQVATHLGLSIDPIQAHLKSMSEGGSIGHPLLDGTLSILWPGISSKQKERFISLYVEAEQNNPLEVFPGSIATLQWLRSNGVYTAVATNNNITDFHRKLRDSSIDPDIFDAISTASSGFYKPDPRMLTCVLEELQASREEAIFVGDWYPDIECAQRARIPFVGVLSGALKTKAFVERGVSANHLVPYFTDLRSLVVEWLYGYGALLDATCI